MIFIIKTALFKCALLYSGLLEPAPCAKPQMAVGSCGSIKHFLTKRRPVVPETSAVFKFLTVCKLESDLEKRNEISMHLIVWLHKIRICLSKTIPCSPDWESHGDKAFLLQLLSEYLMWNAVLNYLSLAMRKFRP